MASPKPVPTKLRILRGETKPSRINANEPYPREGLPTCPENVTKEVREIWDYTLDGLAYMGLAAGIDRDALVAYCSAVAAHRVAAARIEDKGLFTNGPHGETTANPAWRIMNEAANQIRQFAGQFGLTPSARVGLKAPEKDSGQSAERLLA
jgi:P27 family predicted phage terminase small subunit